MNPRKSRVLYIGMVSTQSYVRSISQEAFVGAAAGKMSAVVSALRLANRRAVLVSLPFIGNGPKMQPGRICRGDGFPAYFLPVRRGALERKIFGCFTLAWFALRRVRRGDTVVFYNHAIEYVIALLILRLRGISIFQDIEDVPTGKEVGLRAFADRLGYRLMFALSSPRKITVSKQVGRILGIRQFLAIQGVATASVNTRSNDRWAALSQGGPLRIHFGGTLAAATGLDLFCASLISLRDKIELAHRRIVVIVTGTGDLDRVKEVAKLLASPNFNIQVHEEIDRKRYFELLDSCHTSLSLKNPHAELADTTFPSKVIEITSRGLALIATKVSDVGDIFSNDEAWLLTQFDANELAEILLFMASHPDNVRDRAESGQALTQSLFAPLAIGQALANFIDAERSQP